MYGLNRLQFSQPVRYYPMVLQTTADVVILAATAIGLEAAVKLHQEGLDVTLLLEDHESQEISIGMI